jgi:hypothetical protein
MTGTRPFRLKATKRSEPSFPSIFSSFERTEQLAEKSCGGLVVEDSGCFTHPRQHGLEFSCCRHNYDFASTQDGEPVDPTLVYA